jgi:chitobiase/beta-hexosaminidase-like protein
MALISAVTTGEVPLASFAGSAGYRWWGDLAELIVFDQPLGDAERAAVEGYLARKYALYVPTVAAPSVTPNGGVLTTPASVSLGVQAGAEARYTLDGSVPGESSALYSGPLTVTGGTTLKARAFAESWNPSPVTTVTFLASSSFTPASVAGLKLWVRADAGVAGNAGARTDRWADQSGLANDLVQTEVISRPLVVPSVGAGLPALRFDGSDDWLGFTTRITNARTVFWVVREDPATPASYRYLLGDTNGFPWSSGASHELWSGSYTHASVRAGQTRVNGTLVNGITTDRPTALAVISVVTTGDVPAANFAGSASYRWWGDLAELVVYGTALSDADRRAVEEYLAARYGIALP